MNTWLRKFKVYDRALDRLISFPTTEWIISISTTGVSLEPTGETDVIFNLQIQDRYEILPYIGVKDKHGSPIYVGDVVEYDLSDVGGDPGVGEIQFFTDLTLVPNPLFGIWRYYDSSGRGGGYVPDGLMNCEVIGDKYTYDIKDPI